MDDFVEYLSSQAETESAALHDFILQFNEKSNDLYLFFEGVEDPPFYMPSIRAHVHQGRCWKYVCNGKHPLAGVRQYLVNNRYSLDRMLFFVDRDFDDLLQCQISNEPRTFITGPYSIENYLVGRDQAEIVLVDLAGLSQSDPDCKGFLASFETILERCAKVILPFIAMTLAARQQGSKANLQNIKLANIFVISMDPGEIRRKVGAAQKCRSAVLPKDTEVAFGEILHWARRLRSIDSKLWFRGKYELWFFEKVLLLFLSQLGAKRRVSRRKAVVIPVSLREGRLFEALGGRIGAIPALERFLSANIPSNT